jgi:FdrA protein
MSARTLNEIRHNFYLDSVALMRISAEISALDGVIDAALMVGTPANVEILRKADLLTAEGEAAAANDLIIAVRAADDDAATRALAKAATGLDNRRASTDQREGHRPRSLDAATDLLPDANLALISVPGIYAGNEGRKALRHGLNVMIFSDNVPIEQERNLKEEAREHGLLVMGPDCGTAIVGGVPLAFANAVPRGRIGIIAASGTGLQEVSVLAARAGQGLSHGLGVGSRDLRDEIGGISTLTAIDLLENDNATERLLVISKPPGSATARQVGERLSRCQKPVVLCLLGHRRPAFLPANVQFAETLRAAAEELLGNPIGSDYQPPRLEVRDGRRWLRGLFAGGSMCSETQTVFQRAGVDFHSNVPIPGAENDTDSGGHSLLDLGADEYTVGRPHPMIDPAVRNEMLAAALAEADVAAVLLDVILGFGAHPDPAGSIAAILERSPKDHPPVLASLCGLEGDPQGYQSQLQTLQRAGVVVTPSNAHASELALRAIGHPR